jgi:hypothetical protein
VDDGHPAVIAAFRRDEEAGVSGLLVVCNFDTAKTQRIAIDLGPILRKDGPFTCCELLSGETQVFPHSRLDLLLTSCEARVLKFCA